MISSNRTGMDDSHLCPTMCVYLSHKRQIPNAAYCRRYDRILKVGLTTSPTVMDKIRSIFNKYHSPVLKILIYKYKDCDE